MLAMSDPATTAMTRYLDSGALLNPDASILLLLLRVLSDECCQTSVQEVKIKSRQDHLTRGTPCHFPTKRESLHNFVLLSTVLRVEDMINKQAWEGTGYDKMNA